MNRDILVRRLIALGIAVVFIILVVVLIRGCLDARKERSFDNYLRDLDSVVATTNQLSKSLFTDQLSGGAELSESDFQAAIAADRGDAQGLLQRVEGLDVPGQLAAAQDDLLLAYQLRAEAMDGVATNVPIALGNEGRSDALDALGVDMRKFLASDVIFAQARTQIEQVLEDESYEPEQPVPESRFVPEPVDTWLNTIDLGGRLAKIALDTGAVSGSHGTELVSTIIKPGNFQLLPDQENSVSAEGDVEIEVSVLNGGEAEEVDVPVSFVLSGGGVPIEGQDEIARIGAGNTESISIAIPGDIPKNTPLTMTVTVEPVPGETLLDNNRSIYPVTFG